MLGLLASTPSTIRPTSLASGSVLASSRAWGLTVSSESLSSEEEEEGEGEDEEEEEEEEEGEGEEEGAVARVTSVSPPPPPQPPLRRWRRRWNRRGSGERGVSGDTGAPRPFAPHPRGRAEVAEAVVERQVGQGAVGLVWCRRCATAPWENEEGVVKCRARVAVGIRGLRI